MASDVEVLRNLSDAEAWEPEVLRALSAAISALESLERQAANPPTHQERVHDPARHAWVKPFSDGSDPCYQCRRPKSEHRETP